MINSVIISKITKVIHIPRTVLGGGGTKWWGAILSGLLLALAYPPYDIPGLIWIALVPLLIAALNQNTTSNIRIFLLGYTTGIIYFGTIYIWILHNHPLDWLGISNSTLSIAVVTAIWLLNILFATAPLFGVFTLLINKLKSGATRPFGSAIIIAAAWIVMEYLRALWFSIFFYGPGGRIGAHWTTGHLGYALHDNSLLVQSADIGGIYLLSFLIVIVNCAIYFVIINRRQLQNAIPIILSAAALISITVTYGAYKIPRIEAAEQRTEKLDVALIQTDIKSQFYVTAEEIAVVNNRLQNIFDQALARNPQIIVFPEDARFFMQDRGRISTNGTTTTTIIDSAKTSTIAGIVSKTFYFGANLQKIGSTNKVLLVPFGEYLPFIIKRPLELLQYNNWLDEFAKRRGYVPGKYMLSIATPAGELGTLVCSEPLSPTLTRQLVAAKTHNPATILFNIASESTFHGSQNYIEQNKAVLQIRAIENRRFIAQATNGGHSFVVSTAGKIVTDSRSIDDRVIYGEITPSSALSIYTRLGDWIILLAIFYLTLLSTRIGKVD